MDKEINQRITSGRRRFEEYSHYLKDRKISICRKRKLMDMVIVPVMTYGAETWTLTKLQEREDGSGPTKHGEITAEHYEKRQDPK